MSNLLQAVHRHAEQKPDVVALRSLSQSLSRQALQQAVDVLVQQLDSCSTLGLLLENSPAWVIADLAAIRAKICHIPLPTFFSDEQLLHALTDAGIDHVITDQPQRIQNLTDPVNASTVEIAGQEYHLIQLRQASKRTMVEEAEPISKVTYTSGTTGMPKGVKLPLAQIETVAQSLASAAQAKADDRALVLLPLSTLLENIGSVYAPILAGAQIIIPSAAELGLSGSSQIDPKPLATTLNRCQPTTLIIPPQLLKLLLMLAREQRLPDSFRYIAAGGAPVGRALLDEAAGLGLPIYQGYGLSEACSVVAVNTPDQNRIGSVGKPLSHHQVHIREDGEIVVKGQTYAGYLNDKQRATSSELATGDLGYLDDDGYLYVTGRINNRIISSFGRNISPEWVESELQSNSAILQAAVLGNDQPFLTAVLVPIPGIEPADLNSTMIQVLAVTNRNLPDYAQIREFIVADQPFTVANGQSTANGRPKREDIERFYMNQISTIYEVQHGQVF